MVVYVSPIMAYIALIIIGGLVVLIYLMLKSSNEYSVEDTERSAVEFAHTIKDSHGPITTWLWVVYVVLVVWAIIYILLNLAAFISGNAPSFVG